QAVESQAEAKHDATSANLAETVAASGSVITNGNSTVSAGASNSAQSSAANEAQTNQGNEQTQEAQNSSCTDGCAAGSLGQLSFEEAITTQRAESQAVAEQTATTVDGTEWGISDNRTSSADNNAGTKQSNYQSQDGSSSSCSIGCGVNGQSQESIQSSTTTQRAESEAHAQLNVEGSAGDEAQASGDPQSNASIQLIWQVQLSECVMHCSGAQQSQTAEQRNETAQVRGRPKAAAPHNAAVTESGARVEKSLSQIQLGCVAECFGTTTTTLATVPPSYAQAVRAVIRAIRVDLSKVAAAAEQNTVEQTSYQSQRNPRGASVQTQSASQTNTGVQRYGASPLIAALQNTLNRSAAPEAGNGAVQGIWQLQVGCLMFCNETGLSQRAAQSSSTDQAEAPAQAAPGLASPSVAGGTQLVWQAQIGCLFWCLNTTEQQTAAGQNGPTVHAGDGTPTSSLAEMPGRRRGESPGFGLGSPLPPQVANELTYAATLIQEMLGPKAAGLLPAVEHPRPAPAAASSGSPPTATGTVAPTAPSPALALQHGSALPSGSAPDRPPRHPAASGPPRHDGLVTGSLGSPQATAQAAVLTPSAGVTRSTTGLAAVTQVPAGSGRGLSETAPGSGTDATADISLATLLSVFALCGLCVFGIALAAARRDPRAGKPGVGG
ncbi:MAG TPA: hypothetical protein VGX51_01635, partial [Solirubrobacteraceae bacterium]|nr:hypothetical protein [Solirubrobacteraceae bacterium]